MDEILDQFTGDTSNTSAPGAGFNPFSQFQQQGSGNGTQQSPWATLRQRLDSLFVPGQTPSSNIDASQINPFTNPATGNSEEVNGSPFPEGNNPFDPGFGSNVSNQVSQGTDGFTGQLVGTFGGSTDGNTSQSSDPFVDNPEASLIDETRANLTDSIRTQVREGNTDASSIAAQISAAVDSLVTSIMTSEGVTPSSDAASTTSPIVDVVTPAEENAVIPTDEAILEMSQVNAETWSELGIVVDESFIEAINELIADSSNAGYPTLDNFVDAINSGEFASNLPDFLSEDTKNFVLGRANAIADTLEQYQEIGSSFADTGNPFTGNENLSIQL
jgi:hypothetical protein